MKLTTRFGLDDKVFFYIKSENAFGWGNVFAVNAHSSKMSSSVSYEIDNRFYDERGYYGYSVEPDYKRCRYLSLNEEECFASEAELKKFLKAEAAERIASMKELIPPKKGWFSKIMCP